MAKLIITESKSEALHAIMTKHGYKKVGHLAYEHPDGHEFEQKHVAGYNHTSPNGEGAIFGNDDIGPELDNYLKDVHRGKH
jgi:hypothetical protein